jgi:hypothetical protein
MSEYTKDPRFSALKAHLIRKMHDDLPYTIRFIGRMHRLGMRICGTQIPAIVEELRSALIHEVIDILADTDGAVVERSRPRRNQRSAAVN